MADIPESKDRADGYLVRANICVAVEEAASEEEAKLEAIEQLSDYFRHNGWDALLTVEKRS